MLYFNNKYIKKKNNYFLYSLILFLYICNLTLKYKKMKLIIPLILLLLITIIYNLIDLSPSSKSDFNIQGIDISHHNNIYNWSQLKGQTKFCLIKSTEGKSYKDPMFKSNWKNCKKYNIIRGAYHFFTPGVSADKQFKNFKNRVNLTSNDLPPILDVELRESNMDEVNKWLKLAENYYGVKPIIYSDYFFFKIFMERKVNNYPLWLHIDKKYKVKPSFNNFNCVFWQYNQKGKIKGVKGNIDLNTFLGNSENFNNLLIN
jgi:lysozyme